MTAKLGKCGKSWVVVDRDGYVVTGHRTREAAEKACVHFIEHTRKPRRAYTRRFPEAPPHHPGTYAGGTRESETRKHEEYLKRREEWEARKRAWEQERK
jgi:hypothetical protein